MKVHHITPGAKDKDLGKAINTIIEGLPDNDWICMRDIDTIPPHHRVFFKQCEQIAQNNEADIIGAMTNRIGMKHQLHENKLSENFDIKQHIQIAKKLHRQNGTNVKQLTNGETVAGMFMLFSKTTWLKVGKFPEGAINIKGQFIDYLFCKAALNQGLKIGLATGVYIFHIYREWLPNTRTGFIHVL